MREGEKKGRVSEGGRQRDLLSMYLHLSYNSLF